MHRSIARLHDRYGLSFRGVPAAPAAGPGIARAYELLVLVYLVSLLYVYPYGITFGNDSSIRAPDLLGLLCLAAGLAAVALRQRIRIDRLFLALVGPFVLLELVTPVLGAIAYRNPSDVVSSMRMAILWLPMILLTMLAEPATLPRFERALRTILVVGIWLNAPYAVVQIAVDLGVAPDWMAFTRFLEPWAVSANFEVVLGLRPAGFFVNTTALSVFGVVCLCYFYARYIERRQAADLGYTFGSLFIILLTTSRVAFAGAALIVALGWFALSGGRKVIVLAILLAAAGAMLVAIEETIGLQETFYRFTRLAESGLLADVSFGRRWRETWPAALAVARDYPFGTLISAPRITVLIDSGYLNYYIQGRWLFVASVVLMLVGQLVIGLRALRRSRPGAGGLMILFLSIFLTVAMITSNPARTPLVIAFLVFIFWKLNVEIRSRIVSTPLRPPEAT